MHSGLMGNNQTGDEKSVFIVCRRVFPLKTLQQIRRGWMTEAAFSNTVYIFIYYIFVYIYVYILHTTCVRCDVEWFEILTELRPEAAVCPRAPSSDSPLQPSARCSATIFTKKRENKHEPGRSTNRERGRYYINLNWMFGFKNLWCFKHNLHIWASFIYISYIIHIRLF